VDTQETAAVADTSDNTVPATADPNVTPPGDPGQPKGTLPSPDGPSDGVTFYTREEFVAVRDDVIARVIARLESEPGFSRRLLAELYAASLETRLSLGELDTFLAQARGFVGGAGGKLLGRLGRSPTPAAREESGT
jgi:hypothetical protein